MYNLGIATSHTEMPWKGVCEDMATQRRVVKFTYEDYKHTPEDKRYELIDGDLIMVPAPRTAHQRSSRDIGLPLVMFVDENELGEVFLAPTDVVLSNTDVVQPDILFVSRERSHIINELNIRGAPDLVIEVLSPSTAQRDRTLKRTLYALHGVSEYWQADTDAKNVMVLILEDGEYKVAGIYGEGQTLESPLLAGFALEIDRVF